MNSWLERVKVPSVFAAGMVVIFLLAHLAQEGVPANIVEHAMNSDDASADADTDTEATSITNECPASPCGSHGTAQGRIFKDPNTGAVTYLCDYCGIPVGAHLLPKCG